MKKILLILVAAFFISSSAFSQVMLTWEFGPTSLSPSITFNGGPSDFEIVAYVGVTNTSASEVTLKVVRQELSMMDGSLHQFCWGGICFAPDTDTSATQMTLAPGESTTEFSGHYQPNGTMGISLVKYIFYDVNNPSIMAEVIVHFNSLFSISSTAGDSVSKHMRMISGAVDEELSGMISVNNNSAVPLTFIALKGAQITQPNTENWFAFDGITYPVGVDTSALVTIDANTTDDSFMGYYNPNNVEGTSQIAYVFMDPMNPLSYAVMMFVYDAEATGISNYILENTSFSAAYPNPAESFVSFDYEIPAEVNRAEILITNLLGAVVYEGSISGMNGTERINVSNFTEGIYFATLKLDNQIATTQKILVR